MAAITLDTPLNKISGVGPKFLQSLAKLKIETVKDLLWHFPTRYEDFSQIVPIADLEPGAHVTVSGIIKEVEVRRSWRRHMVIVEGVIEDDTGSVKAIWFNQPYLKNILLPGKRANLSGKVALTDRELYLSHPTHELISSRTRETRHTGRLVPVYPETRGLTSKGLRFLIQPILNNLRPLPEYLPEDARVAESLPEINEALRHVHFPDMTEQALAARRRFAFEDIFLLQLFNFQQKLKLASEKAPPIKADIEHLKETLAALPFELTPSQKKSLWEIIKDLDKPRPMNRLLQGDVGSGKTVVAVLAAFLTCEQGMQSALMAPTEVLAQQHYETIKKLFAHTRDTRPCFPIAFIAASGAKVFFGDGLESEVKKAQLQAKIQSGQVKIVVGTHALIQKTVAFKNIGLVIIDEQHRFGVKQRAALLKRTGTKLLPHFLSMSATPIPRTLMMTIFGDLDISTITELPAGRKTIDTRVVDPLNRSRAYAFIRKEIKAGRQAFVICPRIEPPSSESTEAEIDPSVLEVKSVKEEYEKLSKEIFPDLSVAMLHGQMKPKEKESIMAKFKRGDTDVLVSTSVIEVGVDVPNATIMMIEGAERFGLAQLYQFRGRVGRGAHQSHCFLFAATDSKTTKSRLKALLEAKNGFELAEADLKIRGPGEFLGQQQTGMPDLAMRSLQDISLIKSARDEAVKIVSVDQRLVRHPLLKEKVSRFQEELHLE